MKKEHKEKIAVLLAGALFVVVCVELGLRVFGSFYEKRAIPPSNARPGGLKVLCLGDSFTVGLGAPPDKSYPSRLQSAFNAKQPGVPVTVVNGGVVTQNSSQLLSELQANLDAVRPDAVVVITGLANSWNLQGFKLSAGRAGWGGKIRQYLAQSSVFKLSALLADAVDLRGAFEAGYFCKSQGNVEGFKQCLIRAAKAAPGDTELRAKIGFVFLATGNAKEALDWFRDGIRVDDRHPLNYAGMGLAFMTDGQFKHAEEWFLKELAIRPGDVSVYFRLGTLYKLAGRPAKAREWHLKGIRLEPSYGLNYSAMSWLALEQKKYAEAQQWVARAFGDNIAKKTGRREDRYALAADLKSISARVAAAGPGRVKKRGPGVLSSGRGKGAADGTTLHRDGDYSRAVAWFEQRLKENPSDFEAWFGKGRVLNVLRRHREAAAAFMESLKINAGKGKSYHQMGLIFYRADRIEEGLQWFKAGVLTGSSSNTWESWQFLARTLFELRLYGIAEEMCAQVTSVNPALKDVFEGEKARAAVDAGSENWAIADLEAIIALCRKNGVGIVVGNYPAATVAEGSAARLAPMIARSAAKNNVPLADNYSVFSARCRKLPSDDCFARDGHCNEKGYALMAELVFGRLSGLIGGGAGEKK
ncbi:MAG: hypothetical protein A2234_03400 [Elusimicrobia bacterium RIFOXYA2_FULL_58_8]|nr:MAG: hypothetical protein A2285_00150 [Elusimicrobia bacterium RIFOXYA12_FULL_57_11]OGS17173.1 MAG: hypothetical protein A2234_03400 [Elusimicrobia bacterium RIFOXYA2_FULL_58_8]